MKKKRPRLRLQSVIVIALAIILFSANFTTAFATDATDNPASDVMIVTDDSTTSDGSITPRSDIGSYITKKLIETTYKSKVPVKYLTTDWAKTNHYDINEGYSYSSNFGYSYEGANLSVSGSRTYSVGYTVSADPTRWSKLSAFADFTIKKYLVKRYTTGGVLLSTYYSYTTITTATYVAAKYQQ